MMPSFDELVREIEDQITSDENKLIASALADHAIRITAKAAVDPAGAASESRHLQAAIANLTAAEAAAVQTKLLDYVAKVLRVALGLV